jgi:hypothetical protein
MRDIVKSQRDHLLPNSLRQTGIDMANAADAQVSAEFYAIQRIFLLVFLNFFVPVIITAGE